MSRRAAIGVWGCVAFLVVAVVILLVDLVDGPVFSLSTKTWPPEVRGGKVIGGVEGAVKAADRVTGTVRVASGFLGLNSLRVVITPHTEVAINGKLGGFADLDRGQLVRVAYEVLPDRLLASRVDVLNRSASSDPVAPAPTTSAQTAVAPTSATERVPKAKAAPAPIRRTGAVTASPSKRTTVPPTSSPRVEAQNTPRFVPAPAAGARPADDGSEAVDWLFKGQAP